MPTATVKFVASNKVVLGDVATDCVRYYGTIAFSAAGDTYLTGGLLALAGSAVLNLGPYADRTPLMVNINSLSGSGITYSYNAATKKLQIFGGGGSGTAGLTEITNGTALNGITPNVFTDNVVFEFVFPKTL